MTIQTVETAHDVAVQGAEIFIAAANAAIEARGRFIVALSGGSTPKALYEVLTTPGFMGEVDWSKVEFWAGDERMVPLDHADSNYGMATSELLVHVPFELDSAHPVDTDLSADEAARVYEDEIREFVPAGAYELPCFDLVLLGMGSDGHTASLFPGNPSLEESDRLVAGSAPGTLPPDVERVTFTLPLINAAREIVVLVAGEDKAEMLAQVVEELDADVTADTLPLARVRPVDGELLIVADALASGAIAG